LAGASPAGGGRGSRARGKFHDTFYQRRLSPIAAERPVHRILFDVPALAEASARLFSAECERLELF
jgi:hypothetical protein